MKCSQATTDLISMMENSLSKMCHKTITNNQKRIQSIRLELFVQLCTDGDEVYGLITPMEVNTLHFISGQ